MIDSSKYDMVQSAQDIEYNGDFKEFNEKIRKYRESLVISKSVLSSKLNMQNLDEIVTFGEGQKTIIVDDTQFNCFFHSANSDYLYVFLSGKVSKLDRIFHRWSWGKQDNVLCVADPLFTSFGFNLGWYIGTKTNDYRKSIAKIIKKIIEILGIPTRNVIIYGSSGGGTAALFVSDYLNDSISVSLNPQLNYENWSEFRKMCGKFNYDSCEIKKRLDWKSILNNPISKHIFIVNSLSKDDLYNIRCISEVLNISMNYGWNEKCGVGVWIYSSEKKLTASGEWGYHSSLDTREIFTFIDNITKQFLMGKSPSVDYVLAINEIWYSLSFNRFLSDKNLTLLGVLNKDPKSIYSYAKLLAENKELEKFKINLLESACLCFPSAINEISLHPEYNYSEEDLHRIEQILRNTNVPSDCVINFSMLLNEIGTEHSYRSMVGLFEYLCSEGSGFGFAYLSRAYRDGKGVEVDLLKAAELMRIAVSKNVGWAKYDLFDILWKIGTNESYAEMILLITKYANQGDGGACGRLARAYRDGKGVKKNLQFASELMQIAISKNVKWAQKEYEGIMQLLSKDCFASNLNVNPIRVVEVPIHDITCICKEHFNNKLDFEIFAFDHYGAIASMICYSAVKSVNKNKIFIARPEKLNIIRKLIQNDIVDIFIPSPQFDYVHCNNSEDIIKSIKSYYSVVFDALKLKKSLISNIYCSGDLTNHFAIYSIGNNIPYSFVEFMPNMVEINKKHQTYTERKKEFSDAFISIQKEYGVLYGGNRCKHLVKYSEIVSCMKSLNENQISHILDCFSLNENMFLYKSIQLVVQNSYGYLQGKSEYNGEKIVAVYQMLMDFVMNNCEHTFMKIHPYSSPVLKDINNFYNTQIVGGDVPLEFFNFFKVKISKCLSIESSASNKIEDLIERNIDVGSDFIRNISMVPFLHVSMLFASVVNASVLIQSIWKNLTPLKKIYSDSEMLFEYNNQNSHNVIELVTEKGKITLTLESRNVVPYIGISYDKIGKNIIELQNFFINIQCNFSLESIVFNDVKNLNNLGYTISYRLYLK